MCNGAASFHNWMLQEELRRKMLAEEETSQFSVSQRETQMQAALFENMSDIKVRGVMCTVII